MVTVKINTQNAAFEEPMFGGEIARILEVAARYADVNMEENRMNSHKYYVGYFWHWASSSYRLFAVNYSDGIPASARNLAIIWATSAKTAKDMYSWYYKQPEIVG